MPDGLDPASNPPSIDPLSGDVDNTAYLLSRVRAGDYDARERLVARCLPPLRRWARGRLPAFARGLDDTNDLVQETVLAALARIDSFEARREGALQAYLRQALANRITDIIRKRLRRPDSTDVPDELPSREASPLEQAIGGQNLARYEAALARLRDEDRQAIVARLELQYSYPELAVALGKPSPDAARVAVIRAMGRLAKEMAVTGQQP
jgi:RNA polymerase sigma-70 factor (ECF subfamily)